MAIAKRRKGRQIHPRKFVLNCEASTQMESDWGYEDAVDAIDVGSTKDYFSVRNI